MNSNLADLLTELRLNNRQQSGLDAALVPVDATSAYETARVIAENLGWEIGGWKIAATNARMQKSLRTDTPIFGRVFKQFILDSPALFQGRQLLHPVAEPEFVVKLGADLPARDGTYTRDDVSAAVESIHPGLEIAECRFIHDENFPPLTAVLADGSGSGSVIVGDAIPDWAEQDFAPLNISLCVDGKEKRHGNVGEAIEHPLVPLTWLANELSRQGIALKAGQIVSTGTLTGMILVRPGNELNADFGQFGYVEAAFKQHLPIGI